MLQYSPAGCGAGARSGQAQSRHTLTPGSDCWERWATRKQRTQVNSHLQGHVGQVRAGQLQAAVGVTLLEQVDRA